MTHLEDVPLDRLQEALEAVDRATPATRLIAAIAYKRGVTQTELAEWFDVERRTIYSWLSRLEEGPLPEAATDAPRPGRPRKLADRERLERHLIRPPTAAGYDAAAWTPTLVRRHLREEFGVEYSIPSCRRLMKSAGLRYDPDAGDGGRWRPE